MHDFKLLQSGPVCHTKGVTVKEFFFIVLCGVTLTAVTVIITVPCVTIIILFAEYLCLLSIYVTTLDLLLYCFTAL